MATVTIRVDLDNGDVINVVVAARKPQLGYPYFESKDSVLKSAIDAASRQVKRGLDLEVD